MAINPVMLAAIKALSHKEKDLKKTYKLERKIVEWTHPAILKPFFRIWDKQIMVGDHQVPVRIFFPSEEEKVYPLIIYFHGGGFVTGNIDSYTNVCHHLAKSTEHIVLSVDYRLAPEHPFPAAVEDCYSVVKAVMRDIRSFGITAEQVTLMGDSAGGNLAAVISLLARDKEEFKINRQILIYPLVGNDYSERSPYSSIKSNGSDYFLTTKRINDYIEMYVRDTKDLESPYFSPLLASNLQDQPKSLIITAEFDPLRDEAEAYGKQLRDNGNEVEMHRIPNVIHGYFSLPSIFHEVRVSYQLISYFLNRR